MTEKPSHTRETTEKPNATVEYYRNESTLDKADVFALKVIAPTKKEAEELFTAKLKEVT